MPSDEFIPTSRSVPTDADVIAYTQRELDADAERQSKLRADGIGEFPGKAPAGATLDLSHKNIRALPAEVIFLIKETVERLALSHNPHITLPTEIVQCHRLRYLNLRWNQLKVFPQEVIALRNLEILDLSKNKIVEIPEGIKKMSSLKFLAVARNRITRLPLAFGDMPTLQKILFDDNPIEFPPPDALKPDPHVPLGEREDDVCQLVKRFMRLESVRHRLRSTSDESLSEGTQETPRAPPRAPGGRFPIRPSESNLEKLWAITNDDRGPQLPSQREHNRDISTASVQSSVSRRPAVPPLDTSDLDEKRTRAETLSSAASIRSRRQGFVPTRKPTVDSVSAGPVPGQTLDYNLTAKKSNWQDLKNTFRTRDGAASAFSHRELRNASTPPRAASHDREVTRRRSHIGTNSQEIIRRDQATVKCTQRLNSIFAKLQIALLDVITPMVSGFGANGVSNNDLVRASEYALTVGQQLQDASKAPQEGSTGFTPNPRRVFTLAIAAMRHYTLLARGLRANLDSVPNAVDPISIRALMFQLHIAMVELRNICTMLGFRTKQAHGRGMQPWNARNVTPIQQSRVSTRRMRGATILQTMAGDTSFRAMPPPALPIGPQMSRSNTMLSAAPLTARSGESFPAYPSRAPSLSRSNTLRSVTDESDNEQQHFDQIFLAVKSACEVTLANSPEVRAEIVYRKERAQSEGQSIPARDWDRAFGLYETVTANVHASLNRLRSIRVNDPAVRYQSDFWQLCDSLVQSWTDLASHVKYLSSRRIDVNHIKSLMREPQKAMKTVSKTISSSPLYNPSNRSSRYESEYMSPGTISSHFAPHGTTYSGYGGVSHSYNASGYVTPTPATPLSAALGPAAQATMVGGINGGQPSREAYLPAPPSAARAVHERVDTVVQPYLTSRRGRSSNDIPRS